MRESRYQNLHLILEVALGFSVTGPATYNHNRNPPDS